MNDGSIQATAAASRSETPPASGAGLQLWAVPGIGLITIGVDLATVIAEAITASGLPLRDGDVVVVAQKIVSKAEGRVVDLADVSPGEQARQLAELTGRDPRLCQLILTETHQIVEVKGRHIVTTDVRGLRNTSSGVDMSNVADTDSPYACLLPVNPDASARRLRDGLRAQHAVKIAVIVSDSFGSDHRLGAIGSAIGLAGIRHLEEPAGEQDLFGRSSSPQINRVDELAAAASILMGQTNQGLPVVIVRGAAYTVDEHAQLSRLLTIAPTPVHPAGLP